MALNLIEYSVLINQYNTGQPIETKCNSITFFNAGTSMMLINGIAFQPGQQLSFDGNFGEILNDNYNISFADIPPTGTANMVNVYRKIYK